MMGDCSSRGGWVTIVIIIWDNVCQMEWNGSKFAMVEDDIIIITKYKT